MRFNLKHSDVLISVARDSAGVPSLVLSGPRGVDVAIEYTDATLARLASLIAVAAYAPRPRELAASRDRGGAT